MRCLKQRRMDLGMGADVEGGAQLLGTATRWRTRIVAEVGGSAQLMAALEKSGIDLIDIDEPEPESGPPGRPSETGRVRAGLRRPGRPERAREKRHNS